MRRSFICAVLALTAAACGGSSKNSSGSNSGLSGSPYCDSLGAFANAWSAKVGTCGTAVTSPTSTGSSCATSCATATASCTSADKAVIDAMKACLDKASVCSASAETSWLESLGTCMTSAGSLSPACEASCGSSGSGSDGGSGGGAGAACQVTLSGALTGTYNCVVAAGSDSSDTTKKYTMAVVTTALPVIAAGADFSAIPAVGPTYTFSTSGVLDTSEFTVATATQSWTANSTRGSMALTLTSNTAGACDSGVTLYTAHGTLSGTLTPDTGSGANVTISATF